MVSCEDSLSLSLSLSLCLFVCLSLPPPQQLWLPIYQCGKGIGFIGNCVTVLSTLKELYSALIIFAGGQPRSELNALPVKVEDRSCPQIRRSINKNHKQGSRSVVTFNEYSNGSVRTLYPHPFILTDPNSSLLNNFKSPFMTCNKLLLVNSVGGVFVSVFH